MTEKAPQKHETHEHQENKTRSPEHHRNIEAVTGNEKKEKFTNDSLEKIRESIDQQVDHNAHQNLEKTSEDQPDSDIGPIIIDKNLKVNAFKKELGKIQTQLPKSQRAFSRFVHTNTVDTISNIGSKTIARPSGLLGGSITALFGSAILIALSRYYGFRYNFFVFTALLVSGFFLGLIIEILAKMFFKTSR